MDVHRPRAIKSESSERNRSDANRISRSTARNPHRREEEAVAVDIRGPPFARLLLVDPALEGFLVYPEAQTSPLPEGLGILFPVAEPIRALWRALGGFVGLHTQTLPHQRLCSYVWRLANLPFVQQSHLTLFVEPTGPRLFEAFGLPLTLPDATPAGGCHEL